FDARARCSLLVLAALCGLAGACSGHDAADAPASAVSSSPPSSAAPDAKPSSSQQAATTTSSTGMSAPPTAARPSASVLDGPTDQNRSEPHIAVDPDDPSHLFVVAQGALPSVALDPQLYWHSQDGG